VGKDSHSEKERQFQKKGGKGLRVRGGPQVGGGAGGQEGGSVLLADWE